MVKLNLSPKAEWYDLLPGVRVFAAPATSAVMAKAREDELLAGVDESTPSQEASLRFAKAVAKLVIEDWKGVEDEAGDYAPLEPEFIEAFLDHFAIYQGWQEQFMARWLGLEQEKKASAPAPSGISAGARSTAKPAKPGAKTARRKSTSRKR